MPIYIYPELNGDLDGYDLALEASIANYQDEEGDPRLGNNLDDLFGVDLD